METKKLTKFCANCLYFHQYYVKEGSVEKPVKIGQCENLSCGYRVARPARVPACELWVEKKRTES